MAETPPPVQIGPASYAAWRATTLGALTDTLEERLVTELVGEVDGCRILDAGCGDGTFARTLARRRASVVGVDADPAMVEAAWRAAADAGIEATFVAGELERLPFPDASFDVVIAITVLCFVPEPASAIRELVRVLRPGGRLVLGELGRWSSWAAVRWLRGLLGSATWRAAHFRTAGELRAMLEAAGLTVETVRGAIYYPPIGLTARAPWRPRSARKLPTAPGSSRRSSTSSCPSRSCRSFRTRATAMR